MTDETGFSPAWAVTEGPGHHFFGYYDKSPWDASGRYMLALESSFVDRAPRADDRAAVCLVDLENGRRLVRLADTSAWNWQQGCMLQWLPGAADRLIIYNERHDDRCRAVILDVQTREKQHLPLPVYVLSPDGRSALTLSFARLARTRPGYGYAGLLDPWEADAAPAEDGIWWMDLRTGEHRLILSVTQVRQTRPRPDMDGAIHWFNHIMFSPDGRRFSFLHRWAPRLGAEHKTRLFTAATDGAELRLLADRDLVSHYDWRDPAHILAWARGRGLLRWPSLRRYLGWARRGFTGDRFFLIADGSRGSRPVGDGVLTGDGHCSYSPDRRWILCDTYPDARNMRRLMLYHEASGRRVDIGSFYSPPALTGDTRCDLHPRWRRDGLQVCIDSAHEGSRQMYVVDVSRIVQAGGDA